MDVHLDQWAIHAGFEAVNFAGLDDEDIAGAAFKRLPVHGPLSAAFADKLDFIVRMAVRPRAFPRQSAQQKDRNVHVAVIGADKFVRAAHKRQVFLTDAVHSYPPRVRALLGARQEKSAGSTWSPAITSWMPGLCLQVCKAKAKSNPRSVHFNARKG